MVESADRAGSALPDAHWMFDQGLWTATPKGDHHLIKIATARFKGWFGEHAVSNGLSRLDPAHYRTFHDLYLPRPDGQGSTQLDHVVVSPFGIFVIETKNYRGWIFGSEKQREWTQQICRQKNRFQNTLHQNNLHVRALMASLDLPRDAFLPVVFFIGDAAFKTPMPPNVLNQDLTQWLRKHQEARLDPSAVEKAVTTLYEIHRSTDCKAAARAHVAAIHERNSAAKTSPRVPRIKPPPLPSSKD